MNFSSNFFLKVGLIGCFRELNVRKFRKFSPDHFYDNKNRFYDKKTDFRPETRKSQFPEIATCRPCNREWDAPVIASETPWNNVRNNAGEPAEAPSGSMSVRWSFPKSLSWFLTSGLRFSESPCTEFRATPCMYSSRTFPGFVSGLFLDLFPDFFLLFFYDEKPM